MRDHEVVLPLLYKVGKRNEIRYFEAKICGSTYYTRAGVLKNRDNHQWVLYQRDNYNKVYDVSHGSYRTPEQIAYEHAQSKWSEKKRNDAMTEHLDEITDPSKRQYQIPVAPVLATRYKDLIERHKKYQSCVEDGRKPSIVMFCFPDVDYYVEPKYDGERGTISWCQELTPVLGSTGEVIRHETSGEPGVHIFSRARVEIPHLEHIKSVFKKIYQAFGKSNPQMYGWHFDGEIILPEQSRNKMRSTVSRIKEKHIDNNQISIYIFDIVTTYGMTYQERRKILEMIFSKVNSKYVKLVETMGMIRPTDESAVNEMLGRSLDLGFEGIILREPNMIYPLSNLRINELIKVKPQNTCEYRIISAHTGIDKFDGCIIFDVEDLNDSLLRFSPGMKGWTLEDRREAWVMYQENPSVFIGKFLECVYSHVNEYGTPTECIASRIRDPNDMSTAPNDSTKPSWHQYKKRVNQSDEGDNSLNQEDWD